MSWHCGNQAQEKCSHRAEFDFVSFVAFYFFFHCCSFCIKSEEVNIFWALTALARSALITKTWTEISSSLNSNKQWLRLLFTGKITARSILPLLVLGSKEMNREQLCWRLLLFTSGPIRKLLYPLLKYCSRSLTSVGLFFFTGHLIILLDICASAMKSV